MICARDLVHAARQLAEDHQTRFAMPDFASEFDRHGDFVGRDDVKQIVHDFIDRHDRGYLLLTAVAGFGKSALASRLLRELQSDGHLLPPAFHFIKQRMGDWDDPETIRRSLIAQLRRLHALELDEDEAQRLPAVLQRTSDVLPSGSRQVIVLDGLDEAFGPTGRFPGRALPGLLPSQLPRGIVIVLTSRPGEHLAWLAAPDLCQRHDLVARDHQQDVRMWLRHQTGVGLDEAFIEQLTEASEGVFVAARAYLAPRPSLSADLARWREDPSLIPHGFEGWLQQQWHRMTDSPPPADAANRPESPPPVEAVENVMGLLAVARRPLSPDALEALLEAAAEAEPPGGVGLRPEALADAVRPVIRLAAEWFDPVPAGAMSQPRRFFHTGAGEFLARRLGTRRMRRLHALLAHACEAWQRLDGDARTYALEYRLLHAIEAGQWPEVVKAGLDADYVMARCAACVDVEQAGGPSAGALSMAGIHDDLQQAAARRPPEPWGRTVAGLERFIRFRQDFLGREPVCYGQELANELLPQLDEAAQRLVPPEMATAFGRVALNKARGPRVEPTGHTRAITDIAISEDGRIVASGGEDGAVKVWNAATGQLLAEDRHDGAVSSVSITPDGARIASGDVDGVVKVRDAVTGKLLAEGRHRRSVRSVSITADGARVASGGGDCAVKVWDAATGALLAEGGHRGSVWSVSLTSDGTRVASGGLDMPGGAVKVWDVATGALLAEGRHDGWVKVESVSITPDGAHVASGGADCAVKVWESEYDVATEARHGGSLGCVAMTPDGARFASGGYDGAVKVWDAATGELLAEGRHEGWVTSVSLTPDGARVASGGGGLRGEGVGRGDGGTVGRRRA